jgi:hypothetical protein
MELEPMGRDAIGKIVAEVDSMAAPYADKEAQIAELRETNM